MPTPIIELTEAQQATFDKLVAEFRPDEIRESYPLRETSPSLAPFPPSTVQFNDATGRRWYIRPDGSYTWTT